MFSIRLTNEQFINDSKKIHGDKYDYSKVEYSKNSIKVCIICPKHGEFWQIPMSHKKGLGCIKCGKIKRKNTSKVQKEQWKKDFFIKSNKIHNSFYDYSLVNYTHCKQKIIIICPIHGNFTMTPAEHINKKRGCQKCTNKNKIEKISSNTKKFIEKAKKIHGEKYNYDLVDYKKSWLKVKIFCNVHKIYIDIIPNNHLKGSGCKECAKLHNNYRKSDWVKKGNGKIGKFYIIKCYNENEEFYKFGITFNSVKIRYYYKNYMPYNYEIVKIKESKDLNYIWELERKFKFFKRKNKYIPAMKFPGCNSECFKN